MKLEGSQGAEEKRQWKVVRMDSYSDVPGEIVSADDATGEVVMKDKVGESKSLSFGTGAIRIVRRGRG